ncbi:putative RNA-directed DNA polymerase, eukaryota, reverse transcriptase zinc-binding domain protein [Tanacetum coccineum]
MWIAVYAPQALSSKIALWTSLATMIANWDGILVAMGDFNEVQEAGERFGSHFNKRQADIFNTFISNASLIDVLFWRKMEGFHNLVVDTWNNDGIVEANGLVSFKKKLQHLKHVLIDQGKATDLDLLNRRDSIRLLGDLDRIEATDLAQKARIKWALEGDENSNFFHATLKKNRRQLAIKGILNEGEWIENPDNIKTLFVDHFRNRFQQTCETPSSFDVDMPNHISCDQREFLERSFSRDEIKKAVWDCGGDRAPGPDGFTFKFFTTFWDILESDVILSNATLVTDFRPISLIGCQYKNVGKILANRLSTVIGSCISPEQYAFIKGRNILDGPLILNEVDCYRKRKKQLMIFKVDFEKAFDSLRWDFLDLVMAKLGFGIRWRNWIKGCLRHARSFVLVNGSPTVKFEISRGLRQGDPLSPFLFILAMKSLHALMCKAMNCGIYSGAYIGKDNLRISHLIYADDVIFTGEWLHKNAHNLLCILRCFFLVFGLKINVHKSSILGICVSDEEISAMANVIGCGASKLPLKYLRVPVGCNMARCANWEVMTNKFSSKLSHWKTRMIFVEGRLSLIKSVLSSLPTYFLSLYKAPVSLCSKLESIQNNFFIGGEMGEKTITWVSWNKCLTSKNLGGLGIGSIFALNVGLLFKWIWRFMQNSSDLWARVIKAIYGHNGGIHTDSIHSSNQVPRRHNLYSFNLTEIQPERDITYLLAKASSWEAQLIPWPAIVYSTIGISSMHCGISHWGKKRRQFYAFATSRESARDVYSKRRIIAVTKVEIVEWHDYKHLDWITVRRDDDVLYKFKEGDFHRLRIQDIEDMLLLLVQGKVTNLSVEERIAFNVSLRMFTRRVVIQEARVGR